LCARSDTAVAAAGRGGAGAQNSQENFRPPAALPFIGAVANGETGGAPFFFLFLSAFGFFFSRLLLI
jgi:cell division protein FtsW (lipid II flippase)